jgi:hypothetical protein
MFSYTLNFPNMEKWIYLRNHCLYSSWLPATTNRKKNWKVLLSEIIFLTEHSIIYIQSNLVNPAILLSGHLLFGQNFLTPELFIIPIQDLYRYFVLQVSVRKKIHCYPERLIRNLVLIRNKFNRILNLFHIY